VGAGSGSADHGDVIMLMGSRRQVMGQFTLTPWLTTLGWLACAVMATVAIGMFATWSS
jgi:Mn2+/Fe2+ NRAMP family transporter